uniref:Ephrin RBD domain-containing protein n=1 Tax=Pseudonaja textilis TaxID=8673 RepID=A0A670ZA91_PSETE
KQWVWLPSRSCGCSNTAGFQEEIGQPLVWNGIKFQNEGGYVLYPQIGDRLDLICPGSVPLGPFSTKDYEYYKLYLVQTEQAERCEILRTPNLLLTCDRPEHDMRFTIKFQEYSPNLWGHEFKSNQDYYIISKPALGEDFLTDRMKGVNPRIARAPHFPTGTDYRSHSPQPACWVFYSTSGKMQGQRGAKMEKADSPPPPGIQLCFYTWASLARLLGGILGGRGIFFQKA